MISINLIACLCGCGNKKVGHSGYSHGHHSRSLVAKERVTRLFSEKRPVRTDEWNKKIGASNKGKKKTAEHRKAMSSGRIGMKLSESHCENLSKAQVRSYEKRGMSSSLDRKKMIRLTREPLRRVRIAIKKDEASEKRTRGLGYTELQLKDHIEGLFSEGMTWSNYGEWAIDHIKSISSFPLEAPIYVTNALSNLQPMWRMENFKKGSRY